MANITVRFNEQEYQIACQGGGEERLEKLAEYVIDKAAQISKTMGSVSDIRLMLMTAILLADEIDDVRGGAVVGLNDAQKKAQIEVGQLSDTISHTLKRLEDITQLVEAGE